VRHDGLVTLRTVVDDLGTPTSVRQSVAKVVCLVPSLTEAIAESARELLVGATDWCSHPADLDVTRVRGTKNPNVKKIVDLAPDLVVCNQEENRLLDVERLRAAGIAVWVTQIETLDQAFASLDRLFTIALQQSRPTWLTEAEAVWAEPAAVHHTRAAVAVWRDPWMVVGRSTFTGDLLRRLGIDNVFADHPERYPRVTLQQIRAASPELVVLPDEPYVFHADDGPEAFPDLATALVSGRFLTWYGPSLVEARSALLDQLAQ
jgi:ABC-type Fe3+-hydroxamate transport system substrate-binding protein